MVENVIVFCNFGAKVISQLRYGAKIELVFWGFFSSCMT